MLRVLWLMTFFSACAKPIPPAASGVLTAPTAAKPSFYDDPKAYCAQADSFLDLVEPARFRAELERSLAGELAVTSSILTGEIYIVAGLDPQAYSERFIPEMQRFQETIAAKVAELRVDAGALEARSREWQARSEPVADGLVPGLRDECFNLLAIEDSMNRIVVFYGQALKPLEQIVLEAKAKSGRARPSPTLPPSK